MTVLHFLGPEIKQRDRGAVGAGVTKPLPPAPPQMREESRAAVIASWTGQGWAEILTTECFLWSYLQEGSDSTRELSWFCLSAWGFDSAEPAKGPLK